MSQEILVIGESGSGKSTSYDSLDPAETFIINVGNKPLPFRGWKSKYTRFSKSNPKGNYIESDDPTTILNVVSYIDKNMLHIKNVILDDAQYVMANEYMRKSNEKGFQKFTDIGRHIWDVISAGKNMRDDVAFILIGHPDTSTDADGKTKIRFKTVGKLVDNVVNIEGMFTVVLFTEVRVEPDKTISHNFVTQTDGTTTAKSPRGMFSELRIPNDLSFVIKTAAEYYDETPVKAEA
jgi:hypothetical protein